MEISMILFEETEEEALYLFRYLADEEGGIMRINKLNPIQSEIESMPDDDSVSIALARGALVKLIKRALDGEYPQKLGYCPGW